MFTTVRVTRILDRDIAIAGLVQVRRQWEELAGDECLIDVNGSVGLMLVDVAQALGLTSEEQSQALGIGLVHEYEGFLALQAISELQLVG